MFPTGSTPPVRVEWKDLEFARAGLCAGSPLSLQNLLVLLKEIYAAKP